MNEKQNMKQEHIKNYPTPMDRSNTTKTPNRSVSGKSMNNKTGSIIENHKLYIYIYI